MKSVFAAAAVAALLAAAACAPAIEGGPPIDLPPGLQETAQIGSITLSTGWINAEDDFSDTFSAEVREELSRCMYGTAPIDARIHIDRLERAGRLDMLFRGQGIHTLEGTIEFVDPGRDNLVIGRFPISVATTAGGRIAGLIGDRQMMASEEFGRSVCEQAFGRNPRDRGPHNATRR